MPVHVLLLISLLVGMSTAINYAIYLPHQVGGGLKADGRKHLPPTTMAEKSKLGML